MVAFYKANGYTEFQSLVGKLETRKSFGFWLVVSAFQSLVGKLETDAPEDLFSELSMVSIPCR